MGLGGSISSFLAASLQHERANALWAFHISVDFNRRVDAKKGCTFTTHKGGSGHLTVRLGDKVSQTPMHCSRKELGKKLVAKILKDLGLKE